MTEGHGPAEGGDRVGHQPVLLVKGLVDGGDAVGDPRPVPHAVVGDRLLASREGLLRPPVEFIIGPGGRLAVGVELLDQVGNLVVSIAFSVEQNRHAELI